MEVSKNGSVSGFKCKLHELNSLGWVKKSLEESQEFSSLGCMHPIQGAIFKIFEFRVSNGSTLRIEQF